MIRKRTAALATLAALFSSLVLLPWSPAQEKKPDAGEKSAKPQDARGGGATAAPASKEETPLEAGKGAIAGKVTLKGKAPELKPLEVPATNKDHATCAQHVKNERLVLSPASEVRDAVLAIAGYKPAEKAKPRELTLDNKNCTFVPHVLAATAGSDLKLTNSDSFLHNTHALFSESFNVAVPAGGSVVKKLRKAGLVVMKCDIHTWMQANIQVFDHDLFAVTNATGDFRIANVPPGEYEIEVWHEMLAPAFQAKDRKIAGKVKVEAGKTAELNVALEPPAQ